MDLVRAHVLVQGLVQGVYFRANTAEKARSNGVAGWVRNNSNGAVEAVFEGEKDAVNKVIEWCRTGPLAARVDNVQVRWEEYNSEFNGFSVR